MKLIKKHWKMKTVVEIIERYSIQSKIYHVLKLECNHIANLQWNNKTNYIKYKTKTRCYMCVNFKEK